ncbi:unnamed protein product (macronuclear) [Paramecium tetraurelia]|uniref:DH domain-containing protein n=1 Tax=Paramecium tetraurelia TaxID=5888 RepID=A0DSX3_PARTE|nr:uncharacterized protein GSPATT00019833001 [Paramecium tetraurelia]CAK86140.1 unnamed protein product [Paramecium tetraurelia]|eukprot:XP_001453537.1 hypothetical protein (macronuclear) [Paramecium tetraurelia strain d4-2]
MLKSQEIQNQLSENIIKEEIDEKELLKSRQFSTYKKSNCQEPSGIKKYKSQIIDSDEEDDKKDPDNNDEEVEFKVWTSLKKSTILPQRVQISQKSVEKDVDANNLKPLDFEEVLRQSQITFSQHRQNFTNDESDARPQFKSVRITQIDSDDDDEELVDKVALNIEAHPDLDTEITADNKVMMSVIQSKLSQSIQQQFKQQQSLNQQQNIDEQEEIFKSKIVFINKTPVIIREDDLYIRKVRRIQNYFRFVKPFKKLKKQHRYRVNIINELIYTEKNYVNDLNSIREQIQKPLFQLIDSQYDLKIMFNLDSICEFNQEFLKVLLSKTQNFKEKPYAKIMDEIVVLLPGFRFYFDYCKEYQATRKIRDHYSNTNQVYQKFFNDLLERQPNFFNNLDLESYLIKPVQRLPKYILLFKDLLKHTNKEHPDHTNIEQCLKLFQQINDKNNHQIKTYLEQLKLVELQNYFGQHIILVEPGRVFCFEDFCSTYTDKLHNNIILYAFNNLLLFAQNKQNGQQGYFSHLHLTYQSYVKDKENTDYFEHFFEVVNKTESIIMINQDNESKMALMSKIQEIIQQLKEKQTNMLNVKKQASFISEPNNNTQKDQKCDYEIKVIVIGTEIRNSKFNPYTVYVANIFIQEYQTKVFVRYSQIVSLQTIVNKYDSGLKVPVLQTLNWFLSNDEKVIDERKLLIEKFISSVLNSQKCQNTIEYQKQVLELLNLNPDFFQIPLEQNPNSNNKLGDDDMRKMVLQSQFSFGIKPNLLQSMIMKGKSTNIMQAAKASIQRLNITAIEQGNQIVIGQEASKQPYCIEVSLMDDRKIMVGFKKQTLTLFIKNEVAKFVGLKQWLDFRLFIVDQNKDQRVIDDDETMSSILDAHINENTGLINAFKKLLTVQQKFQFVFRKYFYLQWKQEEADYSQDQQRLLYLINDILWEIRNENFQYNFNQFCLIVALFFYSTGTSQDQLSQLMYKIIPKNSLKKKKDEVWLKEIVYNINALQQELKNLQKDKLQQKNQKCLNNSISGQAQLMLMNYLKTHSLFGMQQFLVECNKQTIQLIQKNFNIKISSHMFIGLNYSGYHILNPETKAILYKCQYQKMTEMKACTTEFSCIIDSTKLSFKTQLSFEIKSLILEFKQLQEFTNQIACGGAH